MLALTGGGATSPSCCGEQYWVDAVATVTDAATLASGLMRFKVPAERMSPKLPVRGPALGDELGEADAVAAGCALGLDVSRAPEGEA